MGEIFVAAIAGFAGGFADALDTTMLRRVFTVAALYFALAMIVGALRREQAPVREGEST